MLPIVHDAYENSVPPKPVSMVVSKPYAPLLQGLSYVRPITWDGNWTDLAGALAFAKTKARVCCTQVYGDGFPIQHRHRSWQYDQWDRAGALQKWGRLPLPINHGMALLHFNKPTILFADHSDSSPFFHKDELFSLLRDAFPNHNVVRMSEFRTKRVIDLLQVYDAATLLVTLDTMHLHLSLASRVPVIALATDRPSRWSGSAWHPRFLAHIRYADYETRKREIIHAAKHAVNNLRTVSSEVMPTRREYGYNPSLVRYGDNSISSYRFHPDPKSWRTEIVINDGQECLLEGPSAYPLHSFEDARLFVFRGKLHASITVGKSGQGISPCIVGYGELLKAGDRWKFKNFYVPKYGNNTFTSQEKNWVFFEHSGKLHAFYKRHPEQIVIQLDGDLVTREYRTPVPPCAYGQIRGGTTPLPYGDQWMTFAHAMQRNDRSDEWWTYHTTALLIDPTPPFQILKVLDHPLISGTEEYFPSWRYCKARVAIPYGAIQENGAYAVSYGWNDSQCRKSTFTKEQLSL